MTMPYYSISQVEIWLIKLSVDMYVVEI